MRILLLAMLFMLIGCTNDESQEVVEPKTDPTDKSEESGEVKKPNEEPTVNIDSDFKTVVEKLKVPWEFVYQNDTFYIPERKGTIVEVLNNETKTYSLDLEKEVYQFGEGGLLGLVLLPNFSEEKSALAYHTYREGDRTLNRIVKIKRKESSWEEVKPILEEIPGARFHNGGRMAIGPDDKLYVTVGDAQVPESAQDLNSLSGKILRMNIDGSIPGDNPFKDSYIYSFGHRNPQGIAWTGDGEVLYSTEHGSEAHDEVNLIRPGGNYGWPVIEGDEKKSGMMTPFIHSGLVTWAPSGITIVNDTLFIGCLGGEKLLGVDIKSKQVETVFEGIGRIRDVGLIRNNIYVITNNTDGRGAPRKGDDRLLKLSGK